MCYLLIENLKKDCMNIYCVWFDNLFQELFSLEKFEFDKYEKLQECLKNEKNTIYLIEAESLKDSFEKYREKKIRVNNSLFSNSIH